MSESRRDASASQPTDADAVADDQQPADRPSGDRTVVVIDDEPAIRTLVRMLIERAEGFELVGEAVDGAEGLELIKRTQPDIVLLDLLMPGIDGRQALPWMIREAPSSMVVVLSALSSVDEADPVFAKGAFAYVEKSALGRLTDEIADLRALFDRALRGETVWMPGGPPRVRR